MNLRGRPLSISAHLAVSGRCHRHLVNLCVSAYGRGAADGRKPTAAKLAEYECGFPAFEDSRSQFDVRFYLVAILFIIFDLEAAFLFPWAVSLEEIGIAGWATMMVFLFELIIGFIYAWKVGALEWE